MSRAFSSSSLPHSAKAIRKACAPSCRRSRSSSSPMPRRRRSTRDLPEGVHVVEGIVARDGSLDVVRAKPAPKWSARDRELARKAQEISAVTGAHSRHPDLLSPLARKRIEEAHALLMLPSDARKLRRLDAWEVGEEHGKAIEKAAASANQAALRRALSALLWALDERTGDGSFGELAENRARLASLADEVRKTKYRANGDGGRTVVGTPWLLSLVVVRAGALRDLFPRTDGGDAVEDVKVRVNEARKT